MQSCHNPCFHTGNKAPLLPPGHPRSYPPDTRARFPALPHSTYDFPSCHPLSWPDPTPAHTESQTGCRESETSLHSPRRRPCGHIKRRRRLTMPVHLLPVSPHMSAVYRHNCGSHEAIPRLSCCQPTGYSPPHFVLPPKILPCRLQRPDIPHAV